MDFTVPVAEKIGYGIRSKNKKKHDILCAWQNFCMPIERNTHLLFPEFSETLVYATNIFQSLGAILFSA